MVAYLRLPGAQLRSSECFLLRTFLDQVRIKWYRGRRVPFGKESSKDKHKIGAKHVRELMRTKRLRQAAATDVVVQIYPKKYFGDETGAKLADFMKRGSA
jgi:hypothetical protein